MIRKTGLLFFVVILLAGICIPAAAQMTDDAVIEYVKEGMANGKSQNDLLKELMASGVTMEQAQRIKKMVESENQGTNPLMGRVDEMDRRRRNAPGVAQLPAVEMQEQADGEEVPEGELNEKKEIFGHNIFSNRRLSFAPSLNIPTPLKRQPARAPPWITPVGAGRLGCFCIWKGRRKKADNLTFLT